MDNTAKLEQAIDTVHRGDLTEARSMLRQIVIEEPDNEIAWDWLGEISPDADERLRALEQVVRINPLNSQAQSRLHYLRRNYKDRIIRREGQNEERAEHAHKLFEQAKAARQEGYQKQALDLLVRYVEIDERNEQAWLLLNELAPGLEDKIIALENVLTLNPKNKEAHKRLKKLRNAPTDPLARGIVYERLNDIDSAVNLYIEASIQAKTRAEKMQARRRLELAQIRQKTPHYRSLPPALTILRLTAGPVCVFFSMFLLQSGFNPLRASPILCLSNFSVLIGSALLALTSAAPVMHLWYSFWQSFSGESEETARLFVWFLAGLLILTPFILLLIDSITRS